MTQGYIIRPVEDRFWEKVNKTSTCWLWTGSTSPRYGTFRVKSGATIQRAHRVSWELTNGPIPDGLCVCHSCDNTLCVNPEHLFLGTHLDNMRDMNDKDRNSTSRLTAEKVIEIRENKLNLSSRKLGKLYGVSHFAILSIRRRNTWAWLEPEKSQQ